MANVFMSSEIGVAIADGIERWLQRAENAHWLEAIQQNNIPMIYQGCIDDAIYDEMEADVWLTATNIEEETFAWICSHDPRQMFGLGFHVAVMRIKVRGVRHA